MSEEVIEEERTPTRGVISPYAISRTCRPTLDTSQLALKSVDTTESIFSRRLIRLVDDRLTLPTIATGMEQLGADRVPWTLGMVYKYRQDSRPTGYGLGDLIYTLSLLPNEEVTMEIKTWETDKRLEEAETGIDAKNTSDVKSTTSSSSEVTDKVATKEHTYVDASAGYSGFGFNASVKAGWSQDTDTMNQQIAKSGRERMEQATSEQRSQRKVKMALSRESGSESKTTRKITNINQAHTLNANFYEVLREHTVSLSMYDVVYVLLGGRVLINQPARGPESSPVTFPSESGSGDMSWGELIAGVRGADWIAAFTARWGISPLAVLRAAWVTDLEDGALGAPHWSVQTDAAKKARREFRDTVLAHTQPAGWVESDEEGSFRWCYEVVSGHEYELLDYVYGKAGTLTERALAELTAQLMAMLGEARAHLGPVQEQGRPAQYTVTSPTQGVYADLSLGVCSGAEDYIEVNRQFDLEKKDLEIALLKAKLENALLTNALVGKASAQKLEVVTDTTGDVDLSIDVGPLGGSDASVAVTSAEET
ncbi:MAG: hypothetical protein KQH57_12925 [Actinomycetales bacterium]|nr:hypothetical protein [Actinomycetales bacterium]